MFITKRRQENRRLGKKRRFLNPMFVFLLFLPATSSEAKICFLQSTAFYKIKICLLTYCIVQLPSTDNIVQLILSTYLDKVSKYLDIYCPNIWTTIVCGR